MNNSNWLDKRILVTGGASFIGSHLVDALVKLGSEVSVVDDLSSGKLENLNESNKDPFFPLLCKSML